MLRQHICEVCPARCPAVQRDAVSGDQRCREKPNDRQDHDKQRDAPERDLDRQTPSAQFERLRRCRCRRDLVVAPAQHQVLNDNADDRDAADQDRQHGDLGQNPGAKPRQALIDQRRQSQVIAWNSEKSRHAEIPQAGHEDQRHAGHQRRRHQRQDDRPDNRQLAGPAG